jgi:hypothetical protein
MPKKNKNLQATDAFLASLDEQSERLGEVEPLRREAIVGLYCCHYAEPRTPFSAMTAMVLAGQIGIPAPMWAIKLVDAAINDYITSPDVKSLDIALGFKGKGTGKRRSAEAPQRLRKVMLEGLCMSVHKLVVAGLPKIEACRQVARQAKAPFSIKGTTTSLWFTNCYSIKPPNADTLFDHYQEWEKEQRHLNKIVAAVSDTATEKDIEDCTRLISRFNNVLRCSLANPSEQMDKATIHALKEFLNSLQPQSQSSET